jgi:hypothetical protein
MPVDKEFRIVGIRRGGNHAINNWVCGLLPKGETLNLRNIPLKRLKTVGDYRRYFHTADEPLDDKLRAGLFKYAVLGYENVHPNEVAAVRGASGKDVVVLVVLRNAFNNAASTVRMVRREQSFKRTRIWVRNYFTFPRMWDLMSGLFRSAPSSIGTARAIMLNYDTWFQDREYREKIAAQLDLPFSDAGLQAVSPGGGGSAFDLTSFDGKAQEMQVLERWRGMEEDPLLNMALLNKAIIKNYKKIYGPLPFLPSLEHI